MRSPQSIWKSLKDDTSKVSPDWNSVDQFIFQTVLSPMLNFLSSLKKVVVGDDRLHIYSHFGSERSRRSTRILIRFLRIGSLLPLRSVRSQSLWLLAGLRPRRLNVAPLNTLPPWLEMMVKELDFGSHHGEPREWLRSNTWFSLISLSWLI